MDVMLPQVFDLDRYVVAELGKLSMHRLDNRKRVRWPIEEIRIAERDVPRARSNLLLDICKSEFAFDHAKRDVVHRHNRAVPAKMLAPARRLGRASNSLLAARHHHARIFRQLRHPRPVRHKKFLPPERNHGLRLRCLTIVIPYAQFQAPRETREPSFKPATED